MPEYPITPVGKPRMTRADNGKSALRFCVTGLSVMKFVCSVLSCRKAVRMSPSFFRCQRAGAKRNGLSSTVNHTEAKPDFDNMVKALMDAIYENDAHIWDSRVSKLWGETGRIIIEELKA